MSNHEKNIGRNIIPKIIGKEPAHEVVNITLAEYLAKPQIERTGLYLIGLAVHHRALDLAFFSEGIDWVLINFSTGLAIMQGSKHNKPTDKEIEKIQFSICQVCFLYERDVWLAMKNGRKPALDA
ncbi:MAG: hypothetical protein P1P90_06110 [Patescibacteria group bacterium]|nr:hypothetical protein [Patescibacteria group bacterium]